ncbi:MAG: LptA/OstA family protein [Solirubrobacterales bacterium]
MRRMSFLLIGVLLLAGAGPAAAQGFNMSRSKSEQIEVYADNGIEWLSDATRVIARGNAKAKRGRVTVTADSLTAYYREGAGGSEIWRLDADGNVTIFTDTETATGTKATYDLDKAIFVLRGNPAKLVTPTDTIVANDTLEYWEKEQMAVGRGDAVATNTEKARSIKADVLSSHLMDDGKGGQSMKRADAYGHVLIVTATERVTGERADYNVETGIATVAGSVKIEREGNELNGGYAHVNLNTGISKLFGAAPGAKEGDGRVRGVFTPDKKDTESHKLRMRGAGAGDSKPEGGQ